MGGMLITNLFPLIATYPKYLLATADREGPCDGALTVNERTIREACRSAAVTIVGWGTNPKDRRLAHAVPRLLMTAMADIKPMALEVSNDGHPKHPLYLLSSLTPQPWTPPQSILARPTVAVPPEPPILWDDDADRAYAETRDCAVWTLVQACHLRYVEAHDLLSAAGRRNGHATPWGVFETAISGRWTERWQSAPGQPRPTVREFLAEHPRGRFAVRVPGHFFAARSGHVNGEGEKSPLLRKLVHTWWRIA